MMDRDKNTFQQNLIECLGQVVSFRRKRLGMSQAELAEATGVDRAFISKVECGKRNPSFGLVANIANGLRMTYSRLVHNCEHCLAEQEAIELEKNR